MPLPLIRGPTLWENRDTFHGNTGLRRVAAQNLGPLLRFKGDAPAAQGEQALEHDALQRQMAQPPPEKDPSPASRASASTAPRTSLFPAPGTRDIPEGDVPVGYVGGLSHGKTKQHFKPLPYHIPRSPRFAKQREEWARSQKLQNVIEELHAGAEREINLEFSQTQIDKEIQSRS